MKRSLITLVCLSLIGLTSFCMQPKREAEGVKEQSAMDKRVTIKPGTTQINYIEFTNSGIATQTKYEIYRDSLVCDYQEMRTGKHERKRVATAPSDFEGLLRSLSEVKLSVKDLDDTSSGGDGYAYVFIQDGKTYLSFNSSFRITGDFESFSSLIALYIKEHPIEGGR